jgi:hypothetical protein
MRQIAEFVAALACGLFTGAVAYVSFVEHPARMQYGVEVAATEFSPSYRRASVMQAILAVLGLLSSIVAWLAGTTLWWAGRSPAGLCRAIHPLRDPANQQAVVEPCAGQAVQTCRLLTLSGALHAVRSVLSGAALLLFLYLLIFAKSR